MVIASHQHQKWVVFWDDIQVCSAHSPKILKFVCDPPSFSQIDAEQVKHIMRTAFVEDPALAFQQPPPPAPPIAAGPAPSTPPQRNQEPQTEDAAPLDPANPNANNQPAVQSPLLLTPERPSSEPEKEEDPNPDADESEEVYDPNCLTEEERIKHIHLQKFTSYVAAKQQLIGKKVKITSKSNRCEDLVWTVTPDITW